MRDHFCLPICSAILFRFTILFTTIKRKYWVIDKDKIPFSFPMPSLVFILCETARIIYLYRYIFIVTYSALFELLEKLASMWDWSDCKDPTEASVRRSRLNADQSFCLIWQNQTNEMSQEHTKNAPELHTTTRNMWHKRNRFCPY